MLNAMFLCKVLNVITLRERDWEKEREAERETVRERETDSFEKETQKERERLREKLILSTLPFLHFQDLFRCLHQPRSSPGLVAVARGRWRTLLWHSPDGGLCPVLGVAFWNARRHITGKGTEGKSDKISRMIRVSNFLLIHLSHKIGK